jgi:hypothetical protein
VTIVQFGGFVWKDGKWSNPGGFGGKPYAAEQFAEWYKCPKALLKKGQSYSDPNNWSTAAELLAPKMRWYFVGIDANGKKVKGGAAIELRPEIDPKRPKDPE